MTNENENDLQGLAEREAQIVDLSTRPELEVVEPDEPGPCERAGRYLDGLGRTLRETFRLLLEGT